MTRIKVTIDSALPGEAEAFVYAYQRATAHKRISLPHGYSTWEEPTVKVGGKWGVTTPWMDEDDAARMMRDFAPAPEKVDPLTEPCSQCAAKPGEPCFPGCLNAAAAKDEASCPDGCEDCATTRDTPVAV